jgi:4-amino-4-deoxy-L-arabinose transferase-like glycosyltransferase
LELRRPTEIQLVFGLTLAAAAVRFATVSTQSFWLDETATVDLLRLDFGHMLAQVKWEEATPPLYYAIAWVWARLFGTGEVGLRSLSALAGTATVPVVWRATSLLGSSRRGAVLAAAFVAANPFLIWYSQEARAYALAVLLVSLSFLFFASVLREPTRRELAGWAIASGLALSTQYFAVFLIAPEAALLLAVGWHRRMFWSTSAAAAAVAGVGLALLPLAKFQHARGRGGWISDSSLLSRAKAIPSDFMIGATNSPTRLLPWISVLLVLAGCLLSVSHPREHERRAAFIALGLATLALALPLGLALVGLDYLYSRNDITVLVPVMAALGIGFGSRALRSAGLAGAIGLCVLGAVTVTWIAVSPRFQRDDWRALARRIGSTTVARAIVVAPSYDQEPLRYYLPALRPLPMTGVSVREIDVIRDTGRPTTPPQPFLRPLSPFRELVPVRVQRLVVQRFRSPLPVRVTPASLVEDGLGTLLQPACQANRAC